MAQRITQEILQLFYSPYSLYPIESLNALTTKKERQGVLLKCLFKNRTVGYADCFVWPELGDLVLNEQLSLLSQGKTTPLTSKAVQFLFDDAQGVTQNNFCDGIKNHFLISCQEFVWANIYVKFQQGFHIFKIKVGKNTNEIVKKIKDNYRNLSLHNIKIRLDFNSVLNFVEVCEFLEEIKSCLSIIDFIEDPCTFEKEQWKFLQKKFGVSLALDRKPLGCEILHENENFYFSDISESFDVIVCKPALEKIDLFYQKLPRHRFVFTSYMDHPVGQLCGLWEAMMFYQTCPNKKESCGFYTHVLYEKHDYINELSSEGSQIIFPHSPHWGFKNLLESETWKPL